LVPLHPLAGGIRRLVGHQDPAGSGGDSGVLPGVYYPGRGFRGAPLAALRGGRLAAGRGRRAARQLHCPAPRRPGEGKGRRCAFGRGVGGWHQQDRLRPAPPLSPGPGDPRTHELPLPQGGHGLAAGRRCRRLPRQHGNPSGELSGPRLLQCHELSGNSRYAPDPDPSGRRAHTGEQDGTGSSPAYPGRI